MTAMERSSDRSWGAARRPAVLGLATCLVAVLAAALPAPAAAAVKRSQSALPAFSSCGALLTYVRRNADRIGGDTGLSTRTDWSQNLRTPPLPPSRPPSRVAASGWAASKSVAGAPSSPARAAGMVGKVAPSFSSTNVQEAGVDEPDIVKTDGRRVFAVADGRLNAFDVSSGEPKLVGSLALAGLGGADWQRVEHRLLLRGDRLLVLTSSSHGYYLGVVLSEVDVSDPAAMTVRRTMHVDDARAVDGVLQGGTARIVVLKSVTPIGARQISQTGVRRFVPRMILRSRVSGRTLRRSLVPCSNVRHQRSFSGLDLLAVLTIDLDKGLFDVDRDAVMVAGARAVYGSPRALYVASRKYVDELEGGKSMPQSRTQIHRFDTSKQGVTSYSGLGEVTGFVLNQYSLSEHEGALRVASTEEPLWSKGKQTRHSESFVTVLATSGPALRRLGRAGGLGKAGGQIYGVRFVGDKGYVVTFRRAGPLYTLDLSDKSDPKVLGVLNGVGFSSYLHPISDDLLLGVGTDATAEGQPAHEQGKQLSLFDVSDPRRPVLKAQVAFGAGSWRGDVDPREFLYWAAEKLAVIPLTLTRLGGPGEGYSPVVRPPAVITLFSGAVGFQVSASSLSEIGRATHPPKLGFDYGSPGIARSFVIDGMLYTFSYGGLGTNRRDTLAPISFEPFPAPPQRATPPG